MVAIESVATSNERQMFVSPRFRDLSESGPIRTRRRERPAALDRAETAIRELDERLSNAEAVLLDFADERGRAVRAKPEFVPAPVFKSEFIPAPVDKPEFIPATDPVPLT